MKSRLPALSLLCLLLIPALARAEQIAAARLMPASAVAYVEVSQPDLLVDKALSPDLIRLLEQTRNAQKYYQSEQYKQSQLGVALVEARMNAKWPQIVRDMAGSIHLAFDPQENAGLLVLRAKSKETLSKLHSTVVDLVELGATSQGKPSPVKSKEYQGVMGWTLGENEFHAIVDDLLLVSNKVDSLKAMVDRLKDDKLPNLAGQDDFLNARAKVAADETIWGMLRISSIREQPKFQAALTRQSDNPLVEFLGGGILDVLKQSPLLVGGLHVQDDVWSLQFGLPHASQVDQTRPWFFARGDKPSQPIRPKGTIASVVVNRDLAGMWLARDELFNEETRAKMAQVDAGLGLYFAGRDFGSQVLGELGPEMQLVATRQEFATGQPTPSIKLPAGALVVQMKNPDEFANTLLLGYQKIIGIINLAGGEKGGPQLLLSGEEYKGVNISKATFLNPTDLDLSAASIHYNASPSCARIGDRFVFGSTIGVVKGVIDALKDSSQTAFNGHTLVDIDLRETAAALADNKDALISQNMLEQGNTRQEAEGDVGVILEVLRAVARASLQMKAEPEVLGLKLEAGPK